MEVTRQEEAFPYPLPRQTERRDTELQQDGLRRVEESYPSKESSSGDNPFSKETLQKAGVHVGVHVCVHVRVSVCMCVYAFRTIYDWRIGPSHFSSTTV